jgi:hypothetical protein
MVPGSGRAGIHGGRGDRSPLPRVAAADQTRLWLVRLYDSRCAATDRLAGKRGLISSHFYFLMPAHNSALRDPGGGDGRSQDQPAYAVPGARRGGVQSVCRKSDPQPPGPSTWEAEGVAVVLRRGDCTVRGPAARAGGPRRRCGWGGRGRPGAALSAGTAEGACV